MLWITPGELRAISAEEIDAGGTEGQARQRHRAGLRSVVRSVPHLFYERSRRGRVGLSLLESREFATTDKFVGSGKPAFGRGCWAMNSVMGRCSLTDAASQCAGLTAKAPVLPKKGHFPKFK